MRSSALRSAGALSTIALALGACGDQAGPDPGDAPAAKEAGAPKHGGKLVMLASGDADSVDPGITYNTAGYVVSNSAHRPLVNYKNPEDPVHPVPDLADSLPAVFVDGKVVTVKIRSGVRFSPPVSREVTSADVKYAIERAFFSTVNNGYVGVYFGDIIGAETGAKPGTQIRPIETPDDRTMVFRLSRSTGGALAGALALPISAPVPKEYAGRFDAENPSSYGLHQVASGPYMIENDAEGNAIGYRAGRSIHLVRNPNWDGATDYKPAYLDEIDIDSTNTESTVASRRILAGSHMVSRLGVPAQVIREAQRKQPDQIEFIDSGLVGYYPLDTGDPPVRRRECAAGGRRRDRPRGIAPRRRGRDHRSSRHTLPAAGHAGLR